MRHWHLLSRSLVRDRLNVGVFHTAQAHIPHYEEDTELDFLLGCDSCNAFEMEVHSTVRHTTLIKHCCQGSRITRFDFTRLK